MPEVHMADVAVVGGGPAGSAAAITLARLGRRVVVIDKARFPRDKCCGDGLTTAALRRVEHLGLDPSDLPSWEPVEDVVVMAADGHTVRLPMPRDGSRHGASVRRSELDAALVDLAVGAGATLLEGNAVVAATCRPHSHSHSHGPGVTLELTDGTLVRAYYAVGADGAWSPLRKHLGLGDPGYLGDWQAGRQYYANVGPKARHLWVWFEPDMLPGYAWSFPLPGNMANVGYGVTRPLRNTLKGQRIDLMARPRIAEVLGPDAVPEGPWKAWPIPASISGAPLVGYHGRVLFVGDAARACDPMTGEGIAQALETGEMAARAMVEAGPDRPERAASRYERRVRWGLALDDNLSRHLSTVLARAGGSGRALRIVDRDDWWRGHFARWMFEDYPRAVLVTPHRWRRHLLSSRGAYPAQP